MFFHIHHNRVVRSHFHGDGQTLAMPPPPSKSKLVEILNQKLLEPTTKTIIAKLECKYNIIQY